MALRMRLRLPRRTVRLRLTALYGALFLLSGAGLLAITYGLVTGRPILGSFAFQQASGGAVRAVAVPPRLLAKEVTAYAYCMRSHGIHGYPLPKVTNDGRVIDLQVTNQVVKLAGTRVFGPANEFCARSIRSVAPGVMLSPVIGAMQASATSAHTPGILDKQVPGTFLMKDGHLTPLTVSAELPTPQERADWLAVEGFALAIMTLVSIGLGWLVAGRVLRPVRLMTMSARQISEENLDARLGISGPDDELKELGDTFDNMLGRLQGAFESQRRFVANASHELRTPLAMMRTSLDVALGKPNPPRDVTVLATKLEEGLNQAENLLDNLLVLARSERAALGPPEVVSLPALAEASVEANNAEVARLGLSVEMVTLPAEVMGNAVLLARMVANLVANAVHHNVPGGIVHISSGSDGKWSRLVVENTGPVLVPERVAQLGQPFYRPGAERLHNGDGSGLGLSIAKAVAAAHGGTLTLHARSAGGLQVVVELPARPPR